MFRACKTGYHRCDTVSRLEQAMLNRLEVVVDGVPRRSLQMGYVCAVLDLVPGAPMYFE